MTLAQRQLPSYQDCFAAQTGALGIAGQQRLRRAAVLVLGGGGVGAAVTSLLAVSGVGKIILVDPQLLEASNFNRYPFARPTDVGKPKVDVVAASFEGRPHCTIVPVIGRAEDIVLDQLEDTVHIVVSSCNTVSSRLAAARLAVIQGVPIVSGAVFDGREALGGILTAWSPRNADLACPACFLVPDSRLRRNESILATVAGLVGSVAASITVGLLSRPHAGDPLSSGNYITVGLNSFSMEALRVLKRPGCAVCGAPRGCSVER